MRDMRVIRIMCALSVGVVVAACNSPSRRQDALTLPTAAGAGNGNIKGSLTMFSTSQGIAGATVKLGNVSTVSDAAGAFQLVGTPEAGTGVITASASGFVFRGVAFNLTPAKAGATLDLIRDAAPFSFTFYREFARNALEGSQLELLKRWTVNPSFYFQQLTKDTGTRVPDNIIQSIQDNFTNSVPELSGGRFSVAAFDKGDGARDQADGWVNVIFYTNILGGYLGSSSVGGNSGNINIRYDPNLASNLNTNPYGCSSIPLAVADHEIIHTMGFWHDDDALNNEFSGPGCPGAGRPAITLYHANIVYSRPVGNMDPDVDPLTTAHLIAPGAGSHPMVTCDFASFRRR